MKKKTNAQHYMIKDAVALRFQNICAERGIAPNELANLAGLTPSTVYSMLNPTRRDISLRTVKRLLDGLEMSPKEFFSSAEFDNLEQEIQ